MTNQKDSDNAEDRGPEHPPTGNTDNSEFAPGEGRGDDIKGKAEDKIGNVRRRVGNALDELGHRIKP